MAEGRYAAKARADDQARCEMGIRFRPTFHINGQRVPGAVPYAQLSQILDEALGAR